MCVQTGLRLCKVCRQSMAVLPACLMEHNAKPAIGLAIGFRTV